MLKKNYVHILREAPGSPGWMGAPRPCQFKHVGYNSYEDTNFELSQPQC